MSLKTFASTVVACGVLFLAAACGGSDAPADATTAGQTTTAAGPMPQTTAAAEDCPISETELSKITGLDWVLQERLTDHQLETLDGVSATVCLFTTGKDKFGDPYSLRIDVVKDADAAAIRDEFEKLCKDNGGKTRGGSADHSRLCDHDGAVIEGIGRDGVVSAYVVNADAAFAAKLTPVFEQIVAAVS